MGGIFYQVPQVSHPSGCDECYAGEVSEAETRSMSVSKYWDEFTTLSRYAPNEVDTEGKKKERFLNGLHDELQCTLVVIPF